MIDKNDKILYKIMTSFAYNNKAIYDTDIKNFIWGYTTDDKVRDKMYAILKSIMNNGCFIRGDGVYYKKSVY